MTDEQVKKLPVCIECNKQFKPTKYYQADYDICKECAETKENSTGYCSMECRITESCDWSC